MGALDHFPKPIFAILAICFLCAAPRAMDIDSCQNLSAVGTTYTLTVPVTSTPTCFNVTAENVTLDCNGFTITGSNVSGTTGIHSNQPKRQQSQAPELAGDFVRGETQTQYAVVFAANRDVVIHV